MSYPNFLIDNEYDIYVGSHPSPEKMLLGAVLERAWRDLSLGTPLYETRQAVAWFQDTPKHAIKYATEYVSFQQVVDGLELSAPRMLAILERLAIAKEFLDNYCKDSNCVDSRPIPTMVRVRVSADKSEQKREASRESSRSLVAR